MKTTKQIADELVEAEAAYLDAAEELAKVLPPDELKKFFDKNPMRDPATEQRAETYEAIGRAIASRYPSPPE